MSVINISLRGVKSYSTEARLHKALSKHGIENHRHLRVNTSDGRWTAVFPASNLTGEAAISSVAGNMGFYARLGFMTFG